MLITKIRNGVKSTAGRVGLMILFLSLFGGMGFLTLFRKLVDGRSGNGIAWVNKEEINRIEFLKRKKAVEDQMTQIQKQFGANAPMVMMLYGIEPDPAKNALNSLIKEALYNDYMRRMGLYVAPEYIGLKLQDPFFVIPHLRHVMPQGIVDAQGNIDMDLFNLFKAQFFTEELKQSLIKVVEQEIAASFVNNSFYLPRYMIDNKIKDTNTLKKYDYLILEAADFLHDESVKNIKEEEIKAHYDEMNKNHSTYMIPARRSGILYEFESDNFSYNISEKEISDHYNKIKRSKFVESPTHVTVNQVVFDNVEEKGLAALKEEADLFHAEVIQHPEQFEELARKAAPSKEKVKNGGKLDISERGKHDADIEKNAYRLKTDGEISPVFKTKDGYAILQRVSRKEMTFSPLSKVEKEVIAQLKERKFSTQFSKLASESIKSEEKLALFVNEYKAKQEIVAPQEKETAGHGQRLFNLKKVGDKQSFVSKGKGYIIVLDALYKKEFIPFSLIQDKVKKDLMEKKATQLLVNCIKEGKDTVAISRNLHTLKKGSVKTSDWIKSDNKEALEKTAVPADLFKLEKIGSVATAFYNNKGYFVLLKELKNGSKKDTETENYGVKAELKRQVKSLFDQAFIASLERNATIKIDISSEPRNADYEI